MRRNAVQTPTPAVSSADEVPGVFVDAALQAAKDLDKDVAEVPITAIARQAGVSRSTLLRRLGGSRVPLDDAVRSRGVDVGGRPSVRLRAVDAAAELIDESGLAATTLEAIAIRADCSIPSLYAAFGGRDGLLSAVFERHSPISDIEAYVADPPRELRDAIDGLYRILADVLGRAPRVLPAMLAEALSRPTSPAVRDLFGHLIPRLLEVIGGWLSGEVRAGRIRDLPLPVLAQQLVAPMLIHLFTRPAAENTGLIALPEIDTVCAIFADNFVRAVGSL